MDLLLMNDIEEYNEKKKQADALKEEMETIRDRILKAMNDAGVKKVETPNGTVAQVTAKVSLKYDEPQAIKWLKENGYGQYIIEKLDATALNKVVKESKSLNESLQPSQQVTYSLTVK